MADPDTDHGFVYTEDGFVDIDASPYFDVTPGLDTTVGGYIDRVYYQLAKAVELELGVFRRSHPYYADQPLHPSYEALQTLYRRAPSPAAAPSTSSSSGTQSPVTANIIPVSSAGSSLLFRYWWLILLTVASTIIGRLVLLLT